MGYFSGVRQWCIVRYKCTRYKKYTRHFEHNFETQYNYNDVMNCMKSIQKLSNEHVSNIASIKELCKIKDKVVYSELSPLEANTLIELICTN